MLHTPKLRSLLVCTIALLAATAAAQNTINVPKDQPTIQAGINAANTGDTVLVAPGTYYENIDFKGKAIFVESVGGPSVTTINGQQNTATVLFQNGESRTSVLNGFTITGGQGNYEGAAGGIYISIASPTIVGNVITANNCYGINALASGPLIQNNTISGTLDNWYSTCGGGGGGSGIWLDYEQNLGQVTPVIIGNIIESNLYSGLEDGGGNGGGGIAVYGGNPVIESNIIRNNLTGQFYSLTTGGEGGGIFFFGGGGLVVQNLIYGNVASLDGGGIAIESYLYGIGPIQLAFINNTIADNSVMPFNPEYAGPGGQQVYNDILFEGYAWINNIITGSTSGASFVCQDIGDSQPPAIFEHNDLYNASGPLTANVANSDSSTCTYPTGTYGNISADPLFNAESTHDYHLKTGSPAIDTGTNSALQLATSLGASPVTTDLDGNPRIQNPSAAPYPIIDMGAYEAAGPTSPQATTILLTPSLYEAPGYGSITLTAQLLSPSGTPTGSATFIMDGATLTSAAINSSGAASIPVTKLVPGIHTFVATYPGQGSFTPATSVHIYVFVDNYQTTLNATSSPNPSLVGQLVTFTATISSPEGGAPSPITFTDQINPSNPVLLATVVPNANGIAIFTTSSLSTGNHPIVVSYAGDATHIGSTVYVTQDVSYASTSVLSVAPTTAAAGAPVTLTATVSATSPPAAGVPTGTVNFFESNSTTPGSEFLNFATLNSSGVASIALTYVTTGVITCVYNGDFNYATSNCNSVPVTISGNAATTTTLTSSLNPSTYAQSVTFKATVSGTTTPTGSITFTDSATTLATMPLDASGNASFTTSSLTANNPGTTSYHLITATYNPTGSFAASSASLQQIVNGLPTTNTLTVSPTSGTTATTYTLTATLKSASSASAATPTGTVTFYISPVTGEPGLQIGSATLSNGTATITSSTLPVSSGYVYELYSGDTLYANSTSNAVNLNITAISPLPSIATLQVAGSSAAGSLVTLIAAVTAATPPETTTPTGTVTFLNGSIKLGTGTLDAGTAQFTTTTLPAGNDGLTCTYSGDTIYAPSNCNTVPFAVVNPPADFTLTGPPSITFPTESSGSAVLTLTSLNSFSGPIVLTCSLPRPATYTCALSPATPTLGPNGTAAATLTLQPTLSSRITPTSTRNGRLLFAALCPLALLLFARRRRSRLNPLLTLALLAILTSALTACGADVYTVATRPGTYPLTVTAIGTAPGSSTPIAHTLALTADITP